MLQRQRLLLVLLALILSFILSACRPLHRPGSGKMPPPPPGEADQMPMPRADPGYLQHLERFSMLAESSEMAKVVSGSELAWKSSGTGGADGLLNFADTWLLVHPMTLLTTSRSTAFSQLAESEIWPILREAGVKGLYVAPVQGGGSVWAKERQSVDTGDDVVQYDFSRVAGDDDQYKRLMSRVIDNNGLLGSDLVPAATGLGPDFFLAARNVREYPGIYCMVEIPEELWPNLPEVASEWSGEALKQTQIDALNAKGLLPQAMRDESLPLARSGGWAATGVVRGLDGNNYRWVYRYYKNPEYAVLNWEDPSQTAHRILSGSAIRQVGLQGQALVGLRFEAFQGLEPDPDTHSSSGTISVEPALTAAQSMSREIRRYGGWSFLRDDNLSLRHVGDFTASGADFVFDSVFSPAAEHALLTGETDLACFMADEMLRLGIDGRRLVHVSPAQDGLNYALPYLSHLAGTGGGDKATAFQQSVQRAMRTKASQISPAPVNGNYLYATGAGLAALALNLTKAETAQAKEADIAAGHSLLIFFKAMQPGVMMLAGQDLSGVLPVQWGALSGQPDVEASAGGGYGLTSSSAGRPVSTMGAPRAPHLYPPADVQVHQKGSFITRIGAFMKARAQYGIAKGKLSARPATKGRGSIALLTRLPDGQSYLLSVCNFSRKSVEETITLEDMPASALARVTVVGAGGSHAVSGKKVTVSLGPWQGRALVLGGGSKNAARAALDPGEKVTPIPETGEE
ncbi:MAG: hypothetical protein LBH65_04030 [Desulfovibrio sp.]|jgi:trehalose synthase|nr:hypothetical protein [Desulfovibrio sp.]